MLGTWITVGLCAVITIVLLILLVNSKGWKKEKAEKPATAAADKKKDEKKKDDKKSSSVGSGFAIGTLVVLTVLAIGTALFYKEMADNASDRRSRDIAAAVASGYAEAQKPHVKTIVIGSDWVEVANGLDECVTMAPVDRTLEITYQQMYADSSVITYPAHGQPYKTVARVVNKYGVAIDSTVADGDGNFHIRGKARYARVLAAPPTAFDIKVERASH